MNCSNFKGNLGHWSSTLDSRHDCSSSVCCPCGGWVNLHNDELFFFKDRSVPICEWTALLQKRDVLEFGMLAISAFLFHDFPRYDRVWPILHMLDLAKEGLPNKDKGYPPLVTLQVVYMLRR